MVQFVFLDIVVFGLIRLANISSKYKINHSLSKIIIPSIQIKLTVAVLVIVVVDGY